jgi:Rieske Fe-S protein
MAKKVPYLSRRDALKAAGGLVGCGGAAVAVVHYLTRHDPRASETVVVGPVSEFSVGTFEKRVVRVMEEGVWTTGLVDKTLWILRNTDDSLRVYSGTCPHMNCTVALRDDQTFECPCHRSSFNAEGAVALGPSPRPLDTLDYTVANGVLSVEFHNFQKGIPEKKLVS